MKSSRLAVVVMLGVLSGIVLARGHALGVTFSQADGLPTGPVTALLADDAGRLWVGGKTGLRVLAGGRFVVEAAMTEPALESPIHQELINDLAVDAGGGLWVASAGTLHQRTADGTWHEGLGADGAGLSQGVEAVVTTDAGDVWAGGENAGLARFDGSAWHRVDQQFRVTHLTVDSADSVWATGGRNGTVLVSDPTGPNERTLQFGHGGLPDATPQALAAAADRGVWVGTSAGLVLVVGGTVVASFDREDGLPSSSVSSLAVEAGGAVWVGTAEGLARIEAGQVDATVGIAAGVGGSPVLALTIDRSGDLWAGGQSGVVRLPISSWRIPGDPVNGFISAAGRTTAGEAFAVDDGELFISRAGGWNMVAGLEDQLVTTAVAGRDGAVLVGTDRGWGRVRNAAFEPDASCCPDRVNTLLEDAAGRVWVGTNEGLWVVGDDDSVVAFRRTDDEVGLGQDPVTDVWTDGASTVWAATLNGGATPFTDLRPGRRVSVNTTSGVLGTDLVDVGLVTATGDLWLGTNLGLKRRVGNDWTTVDAVPGGAITALLASGPDRVWVGTEANGLALVSCELLGSSQCVGSLFDESDGLASRHVTSLELHDGELWIGTARGVTRHALDVRAPSLTVGSIAEAQPGEGEFTELHLGTYEVDGRGCDTACAANLGHDARTAEISLLGADTEDAVGLRFVVETGSERRIEPATVRFVLEPGQTADRTAVAFDRHFNQSLPVELSVTTATTPLYLRGELWAILAVLGIGGFGGKYLWDRRDRLSYRDALIAVRASEAGYEASIEAGAAPRVWQPLQIDLERAAHLHDRLRQADRAIPEVAELGDLLYRALLGPFEKPLGLRADRRPVRLSLDLGQAQDLEALPWEVVHGGAQLEHLAAEGRLAIVRRVGQPGRPGRSRVRRPLRVLVAWATPTGLEFDAAGHCQAISDAIKEGGAESWIDVVPLPHVQRLTLARALDDDVDVLHFIGHGGLGADGPVLLFEGPRGDQHPIDLLTLHRVLDRAEAKTRKPRLVVLSACRSADAAIGRGETSLAAGLVEFGDVSAAIGMGYAVYDDTAGTFSGQLYASLVRHGQIEHAVAVARGVLRSEFPNAKDWMVPRLYAGDLVSATYDLIGGSR